MKLENDVSHALLPLQGRGERQHLYRWMDREEYYVAGKFDDERDGRDEGLQHFDIDEFWAPQIIQYLDRARVFLTGASVNRDPAETRELVLKAQQALAKGMMTFKGCVESSIRVYGPLPAPGVASGEIQDWGASG